MPLYEYYCDCGKEFEAFRSIAERHNVKCPTCKRVVHLKISLQGKHRVAHTFTTIGHDGRVIGQRQTTERTPISGKVPGTDRVINV